MKQIILAFAALLAVQTLVAQDVTYVLFNRDCMNQLEYRYSYPNLKGDNAVWAYSVKPNVQEHYIFMTEGEGHYSPELPDGTITCRNLDLDDAFVAGINRGNQQMLIVFQRQSGGYWLMPVASATLIARKNSKFWVRTQQSSFQFDSLRMVNEQNIAVAGSPTAAYFSGAKLNNCLMEYSFHCEPVKAGQIRSDFQFIPSLGITNDRTGTSASQAMENELQLVRINGKAVDDFITEACPEGAGKIAISKYQKPTNYGDDSFEADKEISSIMQNEQEGESPATYSNTPKGISCSEDWEPGTHIVQKGENLRAIARTYKVSEQNLIKWNNLTNPDRIEICQKIWLKQPPVKSAAARTNKGVSVKAPETQPESGKTVRMQGAGSAQKGIAKQSPKSYDPGKPIVYSTEPETSDYQYFESGNNNGNVRIHTVHRGEYIYKIAKEYGCPEECIRIANNMPIEGDIPLSIGQELIIPECTCSVNGKVIRPTATLTTPDKTVNKQGLTKPKSNGTGNGGGGSPVQYNYDDNRVFKDNDRYENPFKASDNQDKEESKVQLYKEHVVKQGETLRSIAAKYKVDADELSKVNGLKANETPTPGKRLLVPIEDDTESAKPGRKDQGSIPTEYSVPNSYSTTALKNINPKTGAPASTRPGLAGKKPANAIPVAPSPGMYNAETDLDRRVSNGVQSAKQGYDPRQKPKVNTLASKPAKRNPLTDESTLDRSVVDEIEDKEAPMVDTPKPHQHKPKPSETTSPTEPFATQHLVKKGETLKSIAEKYGVDASEIALINNIGPNDYLPAGKRLSIPAENGK